MKLTTEQIQADLDHLEIHAPLAIHVGRLEEWSYLYMKGYMLKLRRMK